MMADNNMDRYVAGEIFTSGICNLNCRYCYIPKNSYMKSVNSDILEKLKGDEYVKYLRNVFGDRLEYLSLWGAEPTMTIDKMDIILPKIVDSFPNLKEIKFSSNFINIDNLIRFFKKIQFSRNIKIEMQISLDGPAFITDWNRMEGASSTIIKNMGLFFDFIKTVDLKKKNVSVSIKFKPTLDAGNIEIMHNRYDLIDEYLQFFSDIYGTGGNIVLSHYITLAIPGEYTRKDGVNFTEFLSNMRSAIRGKFKDNKNMMRSASAYTYRFKRIYELLPEVFEKPGMFTCSGGRSQLQVGKDGEVHICHRTLFLNYEDYRNGIKKSSLENRDIALIENKQIDNLTKNYIINMSDKKAASRFFYVQGMYHNHWRFKTNAAVSLIMEMAYSGQINRKYLNEGMASALAVFINGVTGCHVENLLNTSSVFLPKMSLIAIFGNGAFEETVSDYMENFNE